MLTRIIVAVVLAPLFFVVLFFLDSIWLAALMAAICAMASFELLRATKVAHHNGMYFFTALAAAAILHYNKTDVPRLKAELRAGGLEVRA